MTHADAFLGAVREAPDDDAPRLIYADWLEERGDPRSLFIRAQCVLERLDPADPIRHELEDEAQSLLDRHEKEWTAPLRGVASDWRFRRGFVEEAKVAGANFLEHSGVLFDTFPVVRLRIEMARTQAPAVAALPHLAWVRSLDVSGCRLRDGDVTALLASPHLTRLTELDLSRNEVEGPAVQALVESPLLERLTSLNFNHNDSLGIRALRSLAQSPGAGALRFLGLSFTNVSLKGLRDLLGSPFLKSLTALQAASIGAYGLADLRALDMALPPVLSRLTALDLGGFPAPKDLLALLRLPSLERLIRLHLINCQLRGDAVAVLAESPHFAGLQTLDLSHNHIDAPGLERLAASEHLSRLTALRLGHNAVRDAGAKALAASSSMTRLTVLDLSKNGIGGPGIRALAASPNVAGLTMLDLSENYVNLESVRALASSPRLSRLKELRLRRNGLDKAGADAVAAIFSEATSGRRLPKLDLKDNSLTEQEQAELRRRLGARVEV